MPLDPRETGRRIPANERRVLQRKLDAQVEQLKEFSKDRTQAEETIADWSKNAEMRLETICDICFPVDPPRDPTSAAVLLGRVQGFLEPLRKAHDVMGITGQMQKNLDKTRDQVNELNEEALNDAVE